MLEPTWIEAVLDKEISLQGENALLCHDKTLTLNTYVDALAIIMEEKWEPKISVHQEKRAQKSKTS